MFTGIIKSLGRIEKINKFDSKLELWVEVDSDIWNRTDVGDSIAINGVCLTLVKKEMFDENSIDSKEKPLTCFYFIFDVVDETLDKTNLGTMGFCEYVNIETPLKLSDGLDGHIVQGHIDTIGQIISNELIDDNWLLEVKIDKKWLKIRRDYKKDIAKDQK